MTSQCLRILVIAHQLPYPPDTGGRIRHYHLYYRLAREHRITWVSPVGAADEPRVKDVLKFCDKVIALPADGTVQLPAKGWRNLLMRAVAHLHWARLFEFCFGYVSAPGLMWTPATPERLKIIEQVMSAARYDLIICETIGSVELAPKTSQVPRLISLFDIQSVLFRRLRSISSNTYEDRLFYLPELLKIRRYETRHYRGFDAAIAVSERDKASLARLCPDLRTDVVHNGVDVDYFQPDTDAELDACLVFVGHYGYPPNNDAVHYFCSEILPQIRSAVDNVTFLAVGRDAPPELGLYPGVHVIGTVPDVRPYLKQAAVVVVPVRAGSGTRIKILEAMAMGKAVVSTTLGAEGLDVEHGKHLLLADQPASFAEAVMTLMRDRAQRRALGHEARRLVEGKYSWDIQAARLDGIITDLVSPIH
jgi:glycosyltransferase involved in cell wall biosynthesis